MSARNRVFMILGLLTVGSLIWYFADHATHRRSAADRHRGRERGDSQLQDSRADSDADGRRGPGCEGGQLIAVIESEDLQAARKAAEALRRAQVEAERPRRRSARTAARPPARPCNAEAQVKSAKAALAQAQAQLRASAGRHQPHCGAGAAGNMSAQARDEAVTSLQAQRPQWIRPATICTAAEAALRQARAHELLTDVSARTVDRDARRRSQCAGAGRAGQESRRAIRRSRAGQRQSGCTGGAAG